MPLRVNKVLLFLTLTFLTSWSLAFAYFALGGRGYSASWVAMAVVYMFTPMICALVTPKLIFREPVLRPLGVSWRLNRWVVVGWLLPAMLAVAATGVSLLMPRVHFTPDVLSANVFEFFGTALSPQRAEQLRQRARELPVHPFFLCLVGGSIAGATINAVAAFGEELGWRGLLQREWARWGFWKSSLCIGMIWGVWHAPFILHGYNYPGHPVAGIVAMTAWAMLFSPLIAYVRIRSGTVIAAAIMHGAVNGTAIAPALVISGGDSLRVGVMGIPGMVTLALLNLGLLWLEKTGKSPGALTSRLNDVGACVQPRDNRITVAGGA